MEWVRNAYLLRNLLERQSNREKEKILPSAGSFFKKLQQTDLGQELHLGLPQGPSTSAFIHCFPRYTSKMGVLTRGAKTLTGTSA